MPCCAQFWAPQTSRLIAGPFGLHWKKHCWKEPPPTRQARKQFTLFMQFGAPRQVPSCEQQSCAKQIWQGELSAAGQVGSPHAPIVHLPVQHWAGSLQVSPSVLHTNGPQTLKLHSAVQHSAALMQLAPSGWQTGFPQVPLVHSAVQHSAAPMQLAPSGLQTGGPQTPFVHCEEQHCAGEAHMAPSGWHMPQVCPQMVLTC